MKHAPFLFLVSAALVRAQDPLSLSDAVRIAIAGNKAIDASAAGVNEAKTRITAARAGSLPKVAYSESFTRADNPVFVFGSLLSQGQFSSSNFQLGPLNHPDFVNNFQSIVSADQVLYDGGQTRGAVRSAELSREMAKEDVRRTHMDVIAGVVRAYCDSVLSTSLVNAAELALKSVQADLERAVNVRNAGMATDADVLSIRVHLASVREVQIRRQADADVARAALNDALGLPLDAPHTLTTALAQVPDLQNTVPDLESSAINQRPEARTAKLATSLAESQASVARGKMKPQVVLHTAFEADRGRFVTRAGDNWLVSVGLQWNLFNGFADKARVEESRFSAARSSASAGRIDSAIRLQVRRASADLQSASERIKVAEASVAEAEESLRIVKNRYEAGIATVTDLLRNETALLDARTRQLAAVRDQQVAAVMVELVSGTLTPDSAVLGERTLPR